MQETLIVPLSIFLANFLRLINAKKGEFFKIRPEILLRSPSKNSRHYIKHVLWIALHKYGAEFAC